jgi:very-short-patch-repair endonuclease
MKTLTRYAKENRKKKTRAEKELHRLLMRWGIHFRSQRPVDYYIVDFIILDKKAIVEVDGTYHKQPKVVAYDERRDAYLTAKGYRVLRYDNEVVFSNPDFIREQILLLPDIARPETYWWELYGRAKY